MRTAVVPLLVVAAALFLPCCAACSEECTEQNKGASGCPCSSDQDCSSGPGGIFLCRDDGACALEDPPPASPERGTCRDGPCAADLACGIDDICFEAPACQRIDVPLEARLEDGTTVVMENDSPDTCAHAWSATSGTATFATNNLIFDLEGAGRGAPGCQAQWFAAHRVGSMECDDVVWAIAPIVDGVPTCFGDACAADCTRLGAGGKIGVCP